MQKSGAEEGQVTETDRLKLQFLKDEYLHLQKVVEDFDARAITIKGWSVTFSLAAIVAAFTYHVPAALLLASFTSVLFWVTEAFWKMFQETYFERAEEIEAFFAGKNEHIVPLQIGMTWQKRWERDRHRRLWRTAYIMFTWAHVAIPHVAIALTGVVLYISVKSGALNL